MAQYILRGAVTQLLVVKHHTRCILESVANIETRPAHCKAELVRGEDVAPNNGQVCARRSGMADHNRRVRQSWYKWATPVPLACSLARVAEKCTIQESDLVSSLHLNHVILKIRLATGRKEGLDMHVGTIVGEHTSLAP